MNKTKKCCTCKKVFPLSNFYHTTTFADGHSIRCKPCCNASVRKWQREHRAERNAWSKKWRDKNWKKISKQARYNRLRRDYGVPNDEFDRVYTAQRGRCAVCDVKLRKFPAKRNSKTKYRLAYADHCHRSRKFRALLCPRCNATLGLVGDSVALLRKLIGYLESHDNSVVISGNQSPEIP